VSRFLFRVSASARHAHGCQICIYPANHNQVCADEKETEEDDRGGRKRRHGEAQMAPRAQLVLDWVGVLGGSASRDGELDGIWIGYTSGRIKMVQNGRRGAGLKYICGYKKYKITKLGKDTQSFMLPATS
jgi:hypothetical protein